VRRDRLLLLYPPAWRARYGEEFLAMFESRPLGPQQLIDIVSGAIDAWLSSDVRRTTMAARVTPTEGGSMSLKALACRRRQTGVTVRDGLIGAGVMVLVSAALKLLATAATRAGAPAAAHVLTGLVFPGALTLSMPFWLMKGQPWKAQAVIVGGTMALLLLIGR
jgi:hypothetical protein